MKIEGRIEFTIIKQESDEVTSEMPVHSKSRWRGMGQSS